MRGLLVSLGIATLLGCGPADFSESEISAKTKELMSTAGEQYVAGLQSVGDLSANETVTVHFSYFAPTKSRAKALQASIAQATPFHAAVNWVKEPQTGWFVFGDIPSIDTHSDRWKELLATMVKLGLQNRCELQYWQPARANRQQLSNYAISPSHSAVTALAQGGKRRAVGRAGYRLRSADNNESGCKC